MSLPPLEEWHQRPLLMRWTPQELDDAAPAPGTVLKINSEKTIPFETALFKGNFHMSVRYTDNSEVDPWGEGQVCHGRKRKIVAYLNGEFKKKLAFDDVFFGFVWPRPLDPPNGIQLAMNVCARFSPGTISDIHADKPYLLNLVAGGADNVHIWKPGDPIEEKLDPSVPHALFERPAGDLPKFKNMKERAKWMSKKNPDTGLANSATSYFEPGWTYSFEFYTHLLYLHKFEVHFPIPLSFPVSFEKYFNGQPYPICAQTKSGEKLWDFEIWHEKTTKKTPKEVWRQGPAPKDSPDAQPHTSPKGLEARRASRLLDRKLKIMANGGVQDDSDDSFHSCPSMASFEDQDENITSDEEEDILERSPDAYASSTQSPLVNGLELYVSKDDNYAVVLWSGKRLRVDPSSHARYVSRRRERIPQGIQVKILKRKSDWSEVELPKSNVTGWLRSRHLGKISSASHGGGPEPKVAVITAKRKRVRATPKTKARRHGSYLHVDDEVHVLTHTDKWALILPSNNIFGWVKMSNIRIVPNSPGADDD